MKTASAKRDIPLHSTLLEAGFLDTVSARRAEGAEWLFPELEANAYGSRTQRLSRVLNDFLDAIGLSDPELVFYSDLAPVSPDGFKRLQKPVRDARAANAF